MIDRRENFLHMLLLVAVLLAAFALRVYNLENIPNGLFTDEAARGYDAFSISRTGADMFGNLLPLFPRSFDDYTPALYTYLTVPFVFLLDLSRFSTRLLAAWIGVFTVAAAYLAIQRPFGRTAGLAGAALLAVSPWYVLLSRIGTEWNLLALGPMLTVVLAYRGLRRAKWLIAAGIVGGISLYGYAPVKAFLPLLLLGFILFYRQELRKQRPPALIAGALLVLLGLPVYLFSFTASGLTRFQEVATFYNLSGPEAVFLFVKNYFAYFDPRFLFVADPPLPNIFFIQRLRQVGLLYWFELPLIVLGLVRLCWLGGRDRYFWLFWLLVAPLGINLHIHSPKPALWLTSTPTLHGLAGAGVAYLVHALRRGFVSAHFLKPGLQRVAMAAILVGLAVTAAISVGIMINDLFTQFPNYAAHTPDWGYGMEQGVDDLMRLQPAFDHANLDTFGAISGIYLAYYTRFPPERRQAEVAQYGENAWQRVGPITVGAIEARSLQPGCHVSLTRVDKRANLVAPNVGLSHYNLPNGEPGPLLVTAIASTQTEPRAVQAVFAEQILLQGFFVASPQPDTALAMAPGQAICLVLVWQSTGSLPADYTVFVHLLGPENPATGSPLWAQHDSPPVEGIRPTTSWQPGELIQDMHVLFIPADAPPGRYRLEAGLYDPITGRRLLIEPRGIDRVTLLEIAVSPP